LIRHIDAAVGFLWGEDEPDGIDLCHRA
jgi:hypothetical protein